MATSIGLMTAQEYLHLPDDGRPTELVRGEVLTMNPPSSRHGQICSRLARIIGNFAEEHDLGHVLTNDSGVITSRDPDTVRGADVAFYSYDKVSKGPLPQGYLTVPPDIVFEVLSPSERRGAVLAKVAEYLEAGVGTVCVLDDESGRIDLYFAEQPSETLFSDEELTFPSLLSEFRIPVGRFFE